MATNYNYNPLQISAGIADIVWRMVFPDSNEKLDLEKVLGRESAPKGEIEWDQMHRDDPEAFLELINDKVSRARFDLELEKEKEKKEEQNGQNDVSTVQSLDERVKALEERLRKAIDLNRELKVEAEWLKNNDNKSETGLKLTHAALANDSAPEYLLYSVYDWALDHHGIEISEWARPGTLRPRRQRKHTTKLLNILDAVIEEFYENYDPVRPPKKAAVVAWMHATFPDDLDLLSAKVTDAMFTIVNPDPPRSQSKRQ